MNIEVVEVIQRAINNGRYDEAVDSVNIVMSQPGGRLPETIAPQLFPSLLNADEIYTNKCCSALDKLLSATPGDIVIRQLEVELKQGFEHSSPLVRQLCLRQLNRACQDRRNLKLIGEVGVMKYAILLLADEELAVVKECHRVLLSLATFDEGVLILYSDQGVKLLREVMGMSDTIRYRVFDVIIDSILTSDQALECSVTVGFFSHIIEDLESSDVLLQLTALENVSRLSDSQTAYTSLRNMGIFKGIANWLVGSSPNASYTVPSVIKLFAKLTQKPNIELKKLCSDCPEYTLTVCRLIDSSDISVKFACVDVVTLLNARLDGKEVLLDKNYFLPAITSISELAVRGTEDIKDRALVALAHIFSTPDVYLPGYEAKCELWFSHCSGDLPKTALTLLAHPAPGRQCAAASLLSNLALHKFGLEAIVRVAGWYERLMERRYCLDRESQSQKHALVVTIRRSPAAQELIDQEILNKLTKFVNEGAHYREMEPAAAILQF